MPSTTGFTASKCEGLAASSTGMWFPAMLSNSEVIPRWYFTSPDPWVDDSSKFPSNSPKSCR